MQTEWTWAVTTFNLGKLVRKLARLRAPNSQNSQHPRKSSETRGSAHPSFLP